MAGESIQEGVYFRSDQRPPPSLRLLFVDFTKTANRSDAFASLEKVWSMLQRLKAGCVRDLEPIRSEEPSIEVPSGNLQVLIGYGIRLFEVRVHNEDWISRDDRPRGIGAKLLGGDSQPFDSLKWNSEGSPAAAQTDVVLQFTADTELAVNRAVVEVQKLISDKSLPLKVTTFFGGFQRDDLRSWIDFHDGINNMRESDRVTAIETTGLETPWMCGGTFLAFLRIAVDLTLWRSLSRLEQEILVGRTKLTGCPLESAEVEEGEFRISTIEDCPTSDPVQVVSPGRCPITRLTSNLPSDYRDPRRAANPLVTASHIHRSNQNRGNAGQDSNNRIYRQGYEFLEVDEQGKPRLGLNFIGFQRDMAAIRNILSIETWMGAVNFGGPAGNGQRPKPVKLMSLLAGGFYAVPPKGDPFPGSAIFKVSRNSSAFTRINKRD